jgi:hypothetical protein
MAPDVLCFGVAFFGDGFLFAGENRVEDALGFGVGFS